MDDKIRGDTNSILFMRFFRTRADSAVKLIPEFELNGYKYKLYALTMCDNDKVTSKTPVIRSVLICIGRDSSADIFSEYRYENGHRNGNQWVRSISKTEKQYRLDKNTLMTDFFTKSIIEAVYIRD